MNLQAFHGDKAIKAKYLKRLRAHAAADEIIHGIGWEDGKGCAIGCTLDNYDHAAYETELGIPQSLARLEDCIFEGLQNGESQKFPVQFLNAIKPGADLSRVTPRFLLVVQKRNLVRLKKLTKRDEACEKAVEQVIAVLLGWVDTGKADESAARSAALYAESAAAAGSARYAARYAAESARSAAESAARYARYAARYARYAAGSALYAAWSAAESAARSALYAARSAAESAARSAEYKWMAKTLLKLLREAV